MSRLAPAAAWLLLAPLCFGGIALANGMGGDSPPARIPIPAKVFAATFEDKTGVIVKASRVTFNGEVFVYGTLGEAQVTVPFEKIDHVRFTPAAATEKVTATAVLKAGPGAEQAEVSLILPDDSPWYGETTFGNYQIEVRQLKRISFP